MLRGALDKSGEGLMCSIVTPDHLGQLQHHLSAQRKPSMEQPQSVAVVSVHRRGARVSVCCTSYTISMVLLCPPHFFISCLMVSTSFSNLETL